MSHKPRKYDYIDDIQFMTKGRAMNPKRHPVGSESHMFHRSDKANAMLNALKDAKAGAHHITPPLIPFKHVSKGLQSGKQYSFKQQRPLTTTHIIKIAKHVAAKHGVEVGKRGGTEWYERPTVHLIQHYKDTLSKNIPHKLVDTRLHDAHNEFHWIASQQLHSAHRTPTGKRSTKPVY